MRERNSIRDLARAVVIAGALCMGASAPGQTTGGCEGRWIPGVPPGAVHAVLALSNGDVVVGGDFTSVRGVAADHIARYHPGTDSWASLGAGITAGATRTVYCMCELPSGEIIVGGDFTSAGSVPVGNIAKYNPTTSSWSSLGSGVRGNSGNPFTIVPMPNGDLIIGGSFYFLAGGQPANCVAIYSASTNSWHPLGSGTNGKVTSTALLRNGDVIFGGQFTVAGGVPASKIARYQSATGAWSSVGGGVPGSPTMSVNAVVELPGGDLLVGGSFGPSGEEYVGMQRFARFQSQTSTWLERWPVSYAGGLVTAILPAANGNFIVTGGFSIPALGGTARNAARYSSTDDSWATVGTGTDYRIDVAALASGGDLIAGGAGVFATNSTISAYFARFTVRPVCPPDYDCSGSLGVNDIIEFIVGWMSADPRADFNADGHVNVVDIFGFLGAWFSGCQ